jgi:CheY-like chemotaxis protein
MSFSHGPSSAHDSSSNNGDPPSGENVPHILVVEDNQVNQRVARMQLEGLGYRVDIVSNGVEAVQAIISGNTYALVLMDCTMPMMDGYEATRLIRENDLYSGVHTPIIALTSKALAADRQKCLESGMDDYLHKPVNNQRLKQMIEKWLSESRTTGY